MTDEIGRFVEALKDHLRGQNLDLVVDGSDPWAHGSTEQGFCADKVVDYEGLCAEIDRFSEEFRGRDAKD